MSKQIEIKIAAKRLTPEKFMEAAESFFGLIQGVAKNTIKEPVAWLVEVDKGSAILRGRLENPTPESEECINTVVRGVNSLRTGIKTIPYGFTKEEVRATKKLAALKDGKEIESVFIQNGGVPEDLTETLIPTADAILVGESHIAFGSIEGTIDSMSAKQAFCCMIYEPLYRRDVTCYLQKPELQDVAVEAFKRRSRVLVSGLIHYAQEGFPANITTDRIRVFPQEGELPTVEDIQKIYKLYKH